MNIGKGDSRAGEFPVEFTSFDGFILPSKYEELKEQIENLEINERDVWIFSVPRSGNQSIISCMLFMLKIINKGSTWMREMVWMIVNDCDSKGDQIPIDERCPFLE
jgi:hypothetical protein